MIGVSNAFRLLLFFLLRFHIFDLSQKLEELCDDFTVKEIIELDLFLCLIIV